MLRSDVVCSGSLLRLSLLLDEGLDAGLDADLGAGAGLFAM